MKSILSQHQIALTLKRLSKQILENHPGLTNCCLIGLQPRGIYFSDLIIENLRQENGVEGINYGKLDITFYRDDVRNSLHVANKTDINFTIEGKNVILLDDVLYTGRTIRAALDALLDFGRPSKVELCVLVDRRFSREFPIQATYIGRTIDTFPNDKVKVLWEAQHERNEVVLIQTSDAAVNI